jgi:phosphohistidine phosphatase
MVYLVHHGDAVGPEVDPMRPLSGTGQAAVLRLADEAARLGAKPDAIWHSGKLRARQTAEVFWRICNPRARFSAERGLQPADSPEWMRDQLAGETRELMLVGHMPHLARLLRLLVEGEGGEGNAAFPPHGVVAVERDGGLWRERWRISP